MRTYSLVMVMVCSFFFGMASLGTIGDLFAVFAGPEWTMESADANRYSNFNVYRDQARFQAGRADRMIFGAEPELHAQWESYRETVASRHSESAARDLLTSFVMFGVFGALFFAHWFAYRAYSKGHGAKSMRPLAKVRRLKAKTAVKRTKRATATRRKAA